VSSTNSCPFCRRLPRFWIGILPPSFVHFAIDVDPNLLVSKGALCPSFLFNQYLFFLIEVFSSWSSDQNTSCCESNSLALTDGIPSVMLPTCPVLLLKFFVFFIYIFFILITKINFKKYYFNIF
jgi:hypothetical protein